MEVKDKIERREWNGSRPERKAYKNSHYEMDIFLISGVTEFITPEEEEIESEILKMEEIHWKVLSFMEEKCENTYLWS